MKTVFILFYILIDSSGADQLNSLPMRDQQTCEQQRHWMQDRGIITGESCVAVSYKVS